MTDRKLPDHPDESRIRKAEASVAASIFGVARQASRALRQHDRVLAFVTLTNLATAASFAAKGIEKAIEEQVGGKFALCSNQECQEPTLIEEVECSACGTVQERGEDEE